jgi:parallel beta-helix repeat protein
VVNGGIVAGGHDVIVLGNRLGLDVEGRSLGAPGGGPLSLDGARRDVAGGAADGAGNRVVGPLGVRLTDGAASNLIIGNTLQSQAFFEEDEAIGVLVVASAGNLLVGNRVESGKVGIVLEQGADGNMLRGNTLTKNELGVRAASSGNLIVLNTFSRNRRPAIDQGASNRWDDGATGNYWSDRTSPDANHDGIVDTPRDVPPNGRDLFPLAAPP